MPSVRTFSLALSALLFVWVGCYFYFAEEHMPDFEIAALEDHYLHRSDVTELLAPITLQLKAFQNQNISKAYHGIVSKEFQKYIPFKKFETFVKTYPILTKFRDYIIKENAIDHNHANVAVVLDPQSSGTLVEYQLVLEDRQWRIQDESVHVALSTKNESNAYDLPILVPLENMFQKLAESGVEKVYNEEVSSEFKKITSNQTFDQFIKSYPIITKHKFVNYQSPMIEEGIGFVTVELQDEEDNILLLDFLLTQEDQRWKILGVEVLPSGSNDKESSFIDAHTQDLKDVISGQFKALESGDLEDAYNIYTSRRYKETKDFNAFKSFIAEHPILTKHRAPNFGKIHFNNNIATFPIILSDENGVEYTVEFDLLREDGRWKILSIKSNNPLVSSHDGQELALAPGIPGGMRFSKILIGNEANEQGLVPDTPQILTAGNKDIFINLYYKDAVRGTKVVVIFKHKESQSQITPIAVTIPYDGDGMTSVVFSPPEFGWPKGHYEVEISTSEGLDQFVFFEIK